MDVALKDLVESLKGSGLRVKVDDRDYIRNGAKYFEWERKGVPLRIELGPRDVKQNVCVFKYRAGSGAEQKQTVDLPAAASTAKAGLESMQQELYEAAKERLSKGITSGVTYQEMKEALEKKIVELEAKVEAGKKSEGSKFELVNTKVVVSKRTGQSPQVL